MKTIPAALQSHYELSSTNLCHCLKITREDTTVFAFTDYVEELTVNGQAYSPDGSFLISAIVYKNDGTPDTVAIEGYPEDSDFIEQLRIGLFDNASFELLNVNNQDVTQYITLKKGRIGDFEREDDNLYYINCYGLADYLREQTGRNVQIECDADLGDSRCTVVLATFTMSGTVTSVTNKRKFIDTSISESDNYFQYGLLTWTSGANNGLSAEVYTYTSSTDEFELFTDMPYTIAVGDNYDVYAGCDKSIATCLNIFNNKDNHRGFTLLPSEARLKKLSGLQ